MASKRRRGEVRAVLAGGASADTTGLSADKCGHGMSAFEGASVPAPALDVDDDRDRRALAWWSDPALYGPGGRTVRDAEIARAVLRRRIQSGTVEGEGGLWHGCDAPASPEDVAAVLAAEEADDAICSACDGEGRYALLHPAPWEAPVEECPVCAGTGVDRRDGVSGEPEPTEGRA